MTHIDTAATAIRAFNARQEATRREYALYPSAFADDPLCTLCQEKQPDPGYRICRRCRDVRRKGSA